MPEALSNRTAPLPKQARADRLAVVSGQHQGSTAEGSMEVELSSADGLNLVNMKRCSATDGPI